MMDFDFSTIPARYETKVVVCSKCAARDILENTNIDFRPGPNLLQSFVDNYKSGARGAQMDYECAQLMALAIEELLNIVKE